MIQKLRLVGGYGSPFMMLIFSQLIFFICAYLHAHIDANQSKELSKNNVNITVDQNGFLYNSIIMVIAKALALLSIVMLSMIILSGHMLGFRQFLQNKMFMFMSKTMHLSYLLVPIVAKSYQASLTSAFT